MIKGNKVKLVPAELSDEQRIYDWCFHSETTKSHSGPPDYPENPTATWKEFFDEGYVDNFFTGAQPESGIAALEAFYELYLQGRRHRPGLLHPEIHRHIRALLFHVSVGGFCVMKITDATRGELFEIAAFLDACWKAEYCSIVAPDFLCGLSVEERHKKLLSRFDEGISAFLVMRDGEKMVGASVFGKSFTEDYPEDGEISAIYLHHDYIGKGYGHELFTRIERALAATGYSHFVLDVLSANTRAVSFYKKHGYEKVDDRSVALGAQTYPLTVLRKKNPFMIRQETPADHAAVYALTKAAFTGMEHADGTEQDLVERLRTCGAFIPGLSLVAEKDGKLIGHILFTKITIGGADALCLAPVSVLPEYQRKGVGAALIERGHEIAAGMGYSVCMLVGHAEYYPRFGYERASEYGITQPFPAPDECVMVKFLTAAGKSVTGAAVFPPEFY